MDDRRSTELALAHANKHGEYWHRGNILRRGNLSPSLIKRYVDTYKPGISTHSAGPEIAVNPNVPEKHKLELARKGIKVQAKIGGPIHKAIARGEISASRSTTTVPYRTYRTQKKMSTLNIADSYRKNQADQKDIIAKARSGSKRHSDYISYMVHSFHPKQQTAAAKAIHDDHLGQINQYMNHYLTKSALAVLNRRKAKSLIASRLQTNA